MEQSSPADLAGVIEKQNRREEDKGEFGHINEHHPFPPTRYE